MSVDVKVEVMNLAGINNRSEKKTSVALWALLSLYVYMPLPLASNRPWAVALLGIMVGLLSIWHICFSCEQKESSSLSIAPRDAGGMWQRAHGLAVLLILWIILLAIQVLPVPTSWVGIFDWNTSDTFPVLIGQTATLSVDAYSTRLYLAKACIYLAMLWLTFDLVKTAAQIELLAKTLVFSGFVQAVIAVLLLANAAHYILFFVPIEHLTRAKGTFVYHNHFAGYMELTLAVGIGLMIAKLEDKHAKNWKQRLRNWLALLMSEKVRLRIVLIIMVIGLIASRSRMGNSAFFMSLLAVGFIAIWLSKNATRSTIIFIASLIVLDVVIIGGVVGVEKVIHRIEATNLHNHAQQITSASNSKVVGDMVVKGDTTSEESLEQRLGPGMHSLKMVEDFPLLGTGGGTYHLAFFPYRPFEVRGYFDHAHNDFFEFATEVGLVGMLLLAGMVLHSLYSSIRILLDRHSQFARGMAFASMMGVLTLMIHSAVDFNLQNTTNAMLFLVVMSLPYLTGVRSRSA